MYLASLNDFYTFILDMFLPPRPAYAALTVAAAIYIAWFGPRQERTENRDQTGSLGSRRLRRSMSGRSRGS